MTSRQPTKSLRNQIKNYLLVVSSLILLSAIPYFAGSGLDNPEPIGAYLNSNFPSALPQGLPYQPVFPNITFDSPLTFNEVPNGNKIIVGQRDGKIFWFDKNPNVAVKNSLLDLSDKVGVVWDGGFLGLALHPQFGTPGKNYFYVWYTTEDENSNDFPNSYTTQSCNSEEYWGNFLVLARYEANPTTLSVEASSEQTLLKLRMYGTTHRGGGLLFGDDGFLYLTTGDQTAFKKSQDIVNNLDGGVLRLDVDQDNTKSHPPVRTMPDDHGFSDEITGNGYWIPNDNPFLSPAGENFEEYYSLGHRNPHRMTKDRATGELYVGEIGGGRHEEINVVKKGGNFGWPLYEGLYRSTFCVDGLYNDMAHEQPLVAFPRDEANAIIGGYVYRGNEVPELQGKYLCADYGRGEEIFTVDINTGAYEQYGNFTSTNIISFGEDKQGELYILKQGTSSLFKVTSKNTGFGNTPQLLSETGAFSNLTNLTPTDGLIPYDLVESFWSDGALKKRWMAIPNDGSHDTSAEKVTYSDVDDWDFPVGSVLVKHFELPIDERNPSITKRLETRFSIKASDGNFYFVTYKWNDQQTDAVLLTSGLDESINITKADGSANTQTWSYPSTIDCVSCHNPTTGGTLGTRARYLNKDYTYPKTGRTGNQLVTLSHLGILDQPISDADTNSILTSKSIDDPTASLDDKARSYLDLNCAYCHRPGTGNRGDFDLRLNLDILQTGVLTASPYLTLGIPNEKIVDPGNVSTSILYHRMNSTDPAIRMPPIAKNKIDATAVQMIDDWISQLDPEPCSDRIIMETFTGAPGTTIEGLKNFANYPDAPNSVDELNEFRIPINVADDYGVRVKGLLKAPETGTYYFWVTGDDNVELNLSSDDSANNITRIAYHENWSRDGEWNKYVTQKSVGINLVAGQNYYIEALMNERGGGDNLSVGWRKPSNGNGNSPFQVIPCTAFDPFNGPPIVNITSITLDTNSATILVNDTQQLTATIDPTDATDTSVTWSSSDTNIATVDTNGLVTGVASGSATITVITTDGNFTDEAIFTVIVPVSGITIDPQTVSLPEGNTATLTATVSPSNASDPSISWQSSDDTIATVSTNGTVTAIATGTAIITATTTDGGFTAASEITVFIPTVDVTGISVNPQTLNLAEGDTSVLTATVSPANATNTSITWSSSNSTIASVDTDGNILAITEGEATITATTNDGGFFGESVITVSATTEDCSAQGVITMRRYDQIVGISLNQLFTASNFPDNPSLTIELDKFEIPPYVSNNYGAWVSGYLCAPETGTYYFWVSGDDHVRLNLSSSNESSNTSTIAYHNGHTNLRLWTRYDSQKSIAIELKAGESYYIEAFMKEGVGGDHLSVGWRKPSDGDGIEPSEIIPGSVLSPNETIPYEVAVNGVSVNPEQVSVYEGNTASLTAQVSPSNAANKNVTWVSSDTNVATVDSDGTVTAIAKGNAVILVETNDGGYTAQSRINVLSENEEFCTANGSITMRKYDNIGGISLNELFVATNFPNNPSATTELDQFEIPSGVGNNYGAWISGYLCAPETGTYYFWVSGDDYVQLNLSSDDDMFNIETVAFHNGHTNPKIWDKYTSQKSVGIELEQGKSYYIEGFMKEGVGGDHFAVGWRKPSDGTGVLPAEVIPGYVLSSNAAQQFPLQASLKDFVDIAIINVYPNPATDYVSIETYGDFNFISMTVYDATGRIVNELPQGALQSNGQYYELDITSLAQGVYSLLIVTDDYQQHFEKIIVR